MFGFGKATNFRAECATYIENMIDISYRDAAAFVMDFRSGFESSRNSGNDPANSVINVAAVFLKYSVDTFRNITNEDSITLNVKIRDSKNCNQAEAISYFICKKAINALSKDNTDTDFDYLDMKKNTAAFEAALEVGEKMKNNDREGLISALQYFHK